jgi:hypothetical protein
VKLKKNDKAIGGSDGKDDDKDRDSRSRLRFWRRDGEAAGPEDDGEDDSGHDR